MNPSDVSRLLLDLWNDLHDVRVLWQLGDLRSNLLRDILRGFRANGIQIPQPKREARVPSEPPSPRFHDTKKGEI